VKINDGEQSVTAPKGRATVSRVLSNGSLVELIYDPNARATSLAVWFENEWNIEKQVQTPEGERLTPFSPENNLIKNEAVLLPSCPSEYGEEEQLLSEVRHFIHQYADLSPSFEEVACHYVFLSWVYDAFNELPYLGLRGDFGTGKTRTLLTIGSLCYKPFFASGASTVSPIFHTLDSFRGTLIFDEADFRFSDERAEIVKILNNGNVRGLPVLRTMISRQREFNPQAFQVFGPKIVATRRSYEDKGLESRFIYEQMGSRKLRGDIPINLPDRFKDEARELRNKLLLFRFRRRFQVALDDSLVDPTLEPRLNQILLPLLSIIESEDQRDELRSLATESQAQLIAERGLLVEAQILEVLAELLEGPTRAVVTVAEVTEGVVARYGSDYDRPVTNRWIGGILRRRLNLHTYKSHGIFVIPISERPKVELLCARYGVYSTANIASIEESGDVGTAGT
jgi:hypothetical protein